MASDPSTKLQINFKWEKDGDMINIYAANQAELEQHLTTIQDLATLIMSTSQSLRGVASLRPASSITPSAPASAPSASAPSAASASAAANAPDCRHGRMTYREGVGNKGPWRGYMCAAPKESTDKCKNIYL
jgi:hypothetical protein